jgi:hypothetical protein
MGLVLLGKALKPLRPNHLLPGIVIMTVAFVALLAVMAKLLSCERVPE